MKIILSLFLFISFSIINMKGQDSVDAGKIPFFTAFKDYELAIQKAQKSGKPILLYFSGYGCVNARKIEDKFLTEATIQKFCSKKLEVITLNIDDRTKLEKPFVVKIGERNRIIKTIGQKNANYQQQKFMQNSQPYLIFIDSNGDELISFYYQSDLELNDLKDFLKKGKDLFEEQK